MGSMKVLPNKALRCKQCNAPLVQDCNCPTCLLAKKETNGKVTLANTGFCHMCAEMWRAVNTEHFRRAHQEWLVAEQHAIAKKKALLGDYRQLPPPPKDKDDDDGKDSR